ncbi:MAG: hypothetical protein B7Z22_10350 [Hyphomonas sp. 32-62-5]|jgi:predicted DNA-binding transcriptional regulator AlpA|nr:MAG: hypothetical protein B7Z22_10350 [Hyphomonas sp. 32-62-5]
MSRGRIKPGSVKVAKDQLDLFAAPVASSDCATKGAPASVAVVQPVVSVDPAVPVAPAKDTSVDPRVLDFIVGPSRKRGRPTKALQSDLPQTNDDKRLLDVREAAQRLGLSKSTLDKMRCSGDGPRYIRATVRAVRYDPADLAAFAESRRQRSTSEEAVAAFSK